MVRRKPKPVHTEHTAFHTHDREAFEVEELIFDTLFSPLPVAMLEFTDA